MISNYLKIAWRNIRKHQLFSFINIVGLSIGISTCFIIMLYVQFELSYDQFNKNADNIVRVLFQANINGGKINESVTMPPVAEAMKRDVPQVLDATRIHENSSKIIYKDKVFKDESFANVDANFFSIFTLSMIKGDANTALLQPNTVVMTESTATKYFGSEDPIGKTIIKAADDNTPYTVTGIIKDMPVNSHFHFDILGSMKSIERAYENSWTSGGFHTYLLLRPGTDTRQLEKGFPAMAKKNMGPAIQKGFGLSFDQFITKGNSLGFALQPLNDIHLHADTTTEFEPGGNAIYVYIFSAVAIFMLLIACINFINLSTAGASKRAKEVGIRKVAGSSKFQLIGQFLSESMILAFFALLIAFALVLIGLPVFNNITGRQLTFNVISVVAFIGSGLMVGIIAGIYPAFYLSSFKPIAVLKGKLTNSHKNFGLRDSLVVFQFFISVILIIGTIVVYQQMKFIQNKDLGYNKEQLIILPDAYILGNNENAFKQQILQDPRILNATMSYYNPAEPSKYNNGLAHPQGDDNTIVEGVDYHVDEDYIPTLGMHIASGRNFSKNFPTDSTAIILNETAATALGWNNETAIGKTVIRQNSDKGKNVPFHVIAVVKNFNFKSLHEAISPLYMSLQPEGGLIFKIKTTNTEAVLAMMKKQWTSYNTGEPFKYTFMDDLFHKIYTTEQKTGTILNIFSVLIIIVACLGLFGLATYTAAQRTKEIGIRKVLGASVTQVTQMLSKEFLKLVFIASLVAFPAAWWVMNKWLQSFAYRITISWWIFTLTGFAALMIALITVSFQSIKAALANPVKSLRTE